MSLLTAIRLLMLLALALCFARVVVFRATLGVLVLPGRSHRVALLSVASRSMAYDSAILGRIRENRLAYCARHGYTCITTIAELRAACGGAVDAAAHLVQPESWGKIPMLLQCTDSFDFVAWVDIDALVVRWDFAVERVLLDPPCGANWSFAVSGNDCDPEPSINTGLMVMRGDAAAQEVLRALLELSKNESTRYHPWWEQQALRQVLAGDLAGGGDDALLLGARRHVCVAAARHQAFHHFVNKSNLNANVTCMRNAGAFMVHWAGANKSSEEFKGDFHKTLLAADWGGTPASGEVTGPVTADQAHFPRRAG